MLGGRKEKDLLKCFVDADHAGAVDDRKTTAGYLIYLNEGVVIWRSTKEPNVAASSTESELWQPVLPLGIYSGPGI